MDLMIRQARPPQDQEVKDLISSLNNGTLVSFLDGSPQFSDFYKKFMQWISLSERVDFSQPPNFEAVFSAGTTQAFHNFYLKNMGKDLYLLRGEYPYHRDIWDSLGKPYHWYKGQSLDKNSMLIISVPFSGSGNNEGSLLQVLDHCEASGATVMLDFALVGLGAEIDLNILSRYQCVEQMAFSFSKMFNVGRFYIGICWQRQSRGPLKILNHWNYINWPGMFIADNLMAQFSFDYMAKKYLPIQKEICRQKNLCPSESYFFALGGEEYTEYSRDGVFNRLCLTPLFK